MTLFITFDTNIIYSNYKALPQIAQLIRDYVKFDNHSKLLIPKLVANEHKHQFERIKLENQKKLEKALRELNKLGIETNVLREQANKALTEKLGQRISLKKLFDCNLEVIELDFSVEKISKRFFKERKPFKRDGQNMIQEKGMKDAILWESILAFMEANNEDEEKHNIIFITENSSDFCDSRTSLELSGDLQEDTNQFQNFTFQLMNPQQYREWLEYQGFVSKETVGKKEADSIIAQLNDEQLQSLITAPTYLGDGMHESSLLERLVYKKFTDINIEQIKIKQAQISSKNINKVLSSNQKRIIELQVNYKIFITLVAFPEELFNDDLDNNEWDASNENFIESEKSLELECKVTLFQSPEGESYEVDKQMNVIWN